MYKVLVVEDDKTISSLIKENLSQWGYDAKEISDFHNVLNEFNEFEPDLVLLDISLPYFNGYHWCTQIRRESNVPIIFISSMSDNMNVVMAINMGGDDFIAKPFDMNVLVAKIQAMLRRTYDLNDEKQTYEADGLILNTNSASAIYNNQEIDLTKNDYKILLILLENKRKIVSRDEIMQRLWQTDSFIDDKLRERIALILYREDRVSWPYDYVARKRNEYGILFVGFLLKT